LKVRIFNNYNFKILFKKYGTVAKSNPQSLWLGIQIAQQLNDSATVIKEGAQLTTQFPKSPEYKLFQKMS